MKKILKLLVGFLLLGSCASQSMIIKKSLKESKSLMRRYYTTNLDLADHYLKSDWLSENTSKATVVQASGNLTKYGLYLYAQCKKPSERWYIKNSLKEKSLIAQGAIKALKIEKKCDGFFIGLHTLGALGCSPWALDEPIAASLWVLNVFAALSAASKVESASEKINAYQGIVDVEQAIKEYDEKRSRENEETKN